MVIKKPNSLACERNKKPILNILKQVLGNNKYKLLEVGSGTGQHAVYMATNLPAISWTASDVKVNHSGIELWLQEVNEINIAGPIAFEVGRDDFPAGGFEVIYTANTFHIMSWEKDQLLIKMLGDNLAKDGLVIIYGPFNYKGSYTSQSNKDFDKWLFEQNPLSAIRHFEDINQAMTKSGFALLNNFKMPANNRMLIFKKR